MESSISEVLLRVCNGDKFVNDHQIETYINPWLEEILKSGEKAAAEDGEEVNLVQRYCSLDTCL